MPCHALHTGAVSCSLLAAWKLHQAQPAAQASAPGAWGKRSAHGAIWHGAAGMRQLGSRQQAAGMGSLMANQFSGLSGRTCVGPAVLPRSPTTMIPSSPHVCVRLSGLPRMPPFILTRPSACAQPNFRFPLLARCLRSASGSCWSAQGEGLWAQGKGLQRRGEQAVQLHPYVPPSAMWAMRGWCSTTRQVQLLGAGSLILVVFIKLTVL